MATLPVLNREGKEVDKIELPQEIFGGRVNTRLLYQVITMYRACLRQGTLNTKQHDDVSGGGKKPYRQKGTGRARVGSSRSPLFRGGGTVFGPHPRDFSYAVPKKMKRAALRESLNAKFQSNQVLCLDDIREKCAKTKEFAAILKAVNIRGKILALLDGCDESIYLVSRNIPRLNVVRSEDVNAYDVLNNKILLLTKTSLKMLLERITKS
jgi:large subunit ribosomal protein L4